MDTNELLAQIGMVESELNGLDPEDFGPAGDGPEGWRYRMTEFNIAVIMNCLRNLRYVASQIPAAPAPDAELAE